MFTLPRRTQLLTLRILQPAKFLVLYVEIVMYIVELKFIQLTKFLLGLLSKKLQSQVFNKYFFH